MKPATLKALRGSITKWESIVEGTGEDIGSGNCPLCKRFNDAPYQQTDCQTVTGEMCPVYLATGQISCDGSPYEDWRIAKTSRLSDPDDMAHDDETVMCAVLELEFLRDLLPEGKK
jgi:hypothetical protein